MKMNWCNAAQFGWTNTSNRCECVRLWKRFGSYSLVQSFVFLVRIANQTSAFTILNPKCIYAAIETDRN